MENIYTVLAKAWGELKNPEKDTKGFNYKYATLDQLLDIIRPVYSKHGLFVSQRELTIDGKPCLETKTHLGEQTTDPGLVEITAPKGKDLSDKQVYGSALTYSRRYSLLAAVGVFPQNEDDDGLKASNNQEVTHDRGTASQFKNFTKEMAEKTTRGATPAPTSKDDSKKETPTEARASKPKLMNMFAAGAKEKIGTTEIQDLVLEFTGKKNSMDLTEGETLLIIDKIRARAKERDSQAKR